MTATLLPVPEIAVGANRIDALADDVAALPGAPRRVLLVIDPGLRGVGVASRVEAALRRGGGELAVWDQVRSDPAAAQIDAAAALARARGVGAVVGVGGGSALDVAKLVAAIAPATASVAHYAFAAHPLPASSLPAICVPTTAGTGSETTTTAVFSDDAGRKAWAWGPSLGATKAILDATLCVALPPALTAATGVDALTHAIEAATNRNRFVANDAIAHAAIRLVVRHLPRALAAPADLAAREGMLVAAAFAGIAINNAGTAIGHTIAHALGSVGRVHHGRAAALGLRASLPWNVAGGGAAWADAAEAMGGARDAAALPGLVDAFLRRCGVKIALADELPALTAAALAAEMARPEHEAMRRSNPRESSDDDLLGLARAVLEAA